MKFLLPLLLLSLGSFSGTNIDNSPQNTDFPAQKSIKRSESSDNFVNYWKEDFRKDDEGNVVAICDITYGDYKEMYGKYISLIESDRTIVNATADYEEGYKIEDSIKTLIGMYSSAPKQNERMTLDQKTTIAVVVSIAVFGMSTICVFFVLKNNKIID